MPNLPLAMAPGHVGVQSEAELRENVLRVTAAQVIRNLTEQQADAMIQEASPSMREIVFAGDFEEINEFFIKEEWSDGLPIVPPTIERVERFLRFTDRAPEESLGTLLPDNRSATVWSVAVNGVLAGCRPEYMPILVALVEAMADPSYGVEHSGNTPGSETVIVLNGPIVKQLDFNYEQGVMRDGFRPNTSVGRFWRLYLRNVAGFLLHKNDKATYGNTWKVVIAENEDVLRELGWRSTSEDEGLAAGENAVLIGRYTGGDVISSISGNTPEMIMPYIADSVLRQNGWQITFTVGMSYGTLRPMLLISPIIARTLAKAGWTKQTIKQYLFDHARMPAWKVRRFMIEWRTFPHWDLKSLARLGKIPEFFAESDDPERLVPLVFQPEDFIVVVTGDPLRTSGYTFSSNGDLGYPTSKPIRLPRAWEKLLAEHGRKG